MRRDPPNQDAEYIKRHLDTAGESTDMLMLVLLDLGVINIDEYNKSTWKDLFHFAENHYEL